MNFFKKFGDGGFRKLFWEATKAGTPKLFHRALAKIKEKNKAAYDYLAIMEPKTWSFHAMDSSGKAEHITSNFVEFFN